LKELIDHFKENHELEITMLSCGATMLYNFFMQPKKMAERMSLPYILYNFYILVFQSLLNLLQRSLFLIMLKDLFLKHA